MDAVDIKGLRVDAHVGVSDEERSNAQTLVVDVRIAADLERASRSDEIADTIDYAQASAAIVERIRSLRPKLLEHLAGEVAETLLSFPRVRAVTVQISKETPPVEEDVEVIAVTIERHQR